MLNILLVFLGGGLGSVFRFGIAKIISQHSEGFPWATFVANVVSCLVLGFLLGIQIRDGLTNNSKLLLITGFCGGFSTFSTFSGETMALFQSQNYGLAFAYIGGSILVCLIFIYLGIKLYELF